MIHCEMEEQIDYGKSGQTKRKEKISIGHHLVLKLQIRWWLLVSREGADLGSMASLTILILVRFHHTNHGFALISCVLVGTQLC